MFAAEASSKLGQFSAQPKSWPAARLANHFKITPADAVPPAGTDGFHSGFFGSKAGSQTLGSILSGSTVTDLFRSEDTGEEALSKAFHGSPDAGDLGYVNSCAYNHLAPIKVP